MEPLFHLPIPVDDLDLAKKFYIGTIGCTVGRAAVKSNGNAPPLRHFGVISTLEDWQEMKRRLARRGVEFSLSPRLSFAGKTAEQYIMMLPDGCGNVVEFKSQLRQRVFATDQP